MKPNPDPDHDTYTLVYRYQSGDGKLFAEQFRAPKLETNGVTLSNDTQMSLLGYALRQLSGRAQGSELSMLNAHREKGSPAFTAEEIRPDQTIYDPVAIFVPRRPSALWQAE